MDNYSSKIQLVDEIRQVLAQERSARQESIRRFERIEQMIGQMLSWPQTESSLSAISEPIMVAKGRILSQRKAKTISRDDFDVVLDIRNGTLAARQNSAGHSVLKICKCGKLGYFRLQLLQYMLENPGRTLSTAIAAQIYKTHKVSGNSLAAAIRSFRKAIQNGDKNGPYLLTINKFSKSGGGPVYAMNSQRRYLVIK
jgi:hypothetical protein